MRIFLLDNYDSFTYNLSHLLAAFADEIDIARNDETTPEAIETLGPDMIVISPGPKDPQHSGITKNVIRQFAGKTPVFGVCLGMQAINEVYGGRTVHASEPVHGKTAEIIHEETGMFAGLPSPFRAARYHSLRVAPGSEDIVPTAHTADGVVMALRHRTLPVFGVQYHPESFLSEHGYEVVANIMKLGGLNVQ